MEKKKINFFLTFVKKEMNRFDEIAKNWDAEPRRLKLAGNIFKSIEKKVNLTPEMKVSDIGCGTGLLLMHFITKVKKITGADNSAGMLEILKEKAKKTNSENIDFMLFDADKDELPENEYDLIVSSMTFHHIENIEGILNKAYKALKKDGKICIGDLETEPGDFHSEPSEDIKHKGFDKQEFADKMKNAGYKNISTETIFEIEKNGKKYPIFLAYGEK